MQHAISIDTDQFKQSFREEAREILIDLESALLELNEHVEDRELVDRVFRALHTIKGSGAMFGFERLAAFTHQLETAFDRVRSGKSPVCAELIDLTLGAVDAIRSMLEDDEGSKESCLCQEILTKVRQLAEFPDEPSVTMGVSIPDKFTASEPAREWRIHFAPGAAMLRNGANPLLLLRELRALGELSIRACTDKIPPLSEIDPERCYIAWDLALTTEAGEQSIRDVFIFVEGDCELTVGPADSQSDRAATASNERSSADAQSSEDPHATTGNIRNLLCRREPRRKNQCMNFRVAQMRIPADQSPFYGLFAHGNCINARAIITDFDQYARALMSSSKADPRGSRLAILCAYLR